ncbi:MAG: amine oxidase, partial [Cytophagales bacterium]|nr:amine oxidase [Cytophagales bacterium]
EIPMQVHLKSGKTLTRFQSIESWISEAERVFGTKGQRQFWETCYSISQQVWKTSLQQLSFPPENFSDLIQLAKNVQIGQIRSLPFALYSVQWLLEKYGLDQNEEFCEFIDEQLMITAQNHRREVNLLFGGTSLCYTNYGNYYMPGGLINLVNPFIEYITANGGQINLREKVECVVFKEGIYHITTNKSNYRSKTLVSGIPLNNIVKIYPDLPQRSLKKKIFPESSVNSAFQVGIAFRNGKKSDCLHHQIHLDEQLPGLSSHSIFLSLSHPQDNTRSDIENMTVGSISTHVSLPATKDVEKEKIKEKIIELLEKRGFFQKEDLVYSHCSNQNDWEKWTNRQWGFVGGYPQTMKIKPWNMPGARLDGKKAYTCGDSSYPGQGIPGVVLSGIIAFEKMQRDSNI